MSDNPMYWPGHQRPTWHQQPPTAQPVNSMTHYANHPGNMLANSMAPGIPGDPTLQMQSPIPGRHQAPPHQTLSQHQSSLAPPPPGAQSSLYPSMMLAPGAPTSARPSASQLTSNSHISPPTQGIPPPHPSLQQATHPQSHYSHQYSSLAPPYWNPSSMSSQPSLGPTGGPTGAAQSSAGQPSTQLDGASSYHSASASPLTMPNENRGGSISGNSLSASMQQQQQTGPSFHSPKDIQSSSTHMMSYDRQRNSMPQQQQHSSAIMSQNIPSSTASNLSPTQSQMNMQGRLQSQTQLDAMRSMSQQPSAASNWSSSYYAQPSQTPYSSVMHPYMPYSGSSAVSNHPSAVGQPTTRPTMTQKPSINGSERTRVAYPSHAPTIYGQTPPSGASSANGGYYGYDPYYNQVSNQATSDPYVPHPNSASSTQNWPSPAPNNQLISNSSTAPGPLPLRPQTGSSSSNIHPQSPSAPSSLPQISSRPPPPSQTPERSPAPYPSPNQQGSSAKSTSSSLAQLEQMVMPNSGQNTAPATKSPTHRSSTSSPSTANSQLQYSYNSSGQGSYFTSSSNTTPNQAGYYPQQYDPSSMDMQKPGWSEQGASNIGGMSSLGPPSGQVMMDGGQGSYGQPGYDATSSYGDYAPLSTPENNSVMSRFPGDSTEPNQADKSDPYAIDSQTFDDYEDQSSTSKTKRSRAKKGDDKTKKERKPRAPRAPKGANLSAQPQSPTATSSLQALQTKQPQMLPQTSAISPAPLQQQSPYSSQQQVLSKPDAQAPVEQTIVPNNVVSPLKSPPLKLSSGSPDIAGQQQQSTLPYSYNNAGQSGYYSPMPNAPPNQAAYYSPVSTVPYESRADLSKSWPEQPPNTRSNETGAQQPDNASIEGTQGPYSQSYEGSGTYGEYPSLPTSASVTTKPQYPTLDTAADVNPADGEDTQMIESCTTEEGFEQAAGPKSKKSRAKKGEEKVKKERKPRAARGSKSGSSSAQPSSPATSTPTQALGILDTTTSPPPTSSYSSPNQQSFQSKPLSDPYTQAEGIASVTSGTSTPIKSPSHRLSTESPSNIVPTSGHYTYGSQPTNYGPGPPGHPQTGYYVPYEPSKVDTQKPVWQEQSVAEEVPLPGPPMIDGGTSSYGHPNYDAASSYPDYSSIPASNSATQFNHDVPELPPREPDEPSSQHEQTSEDIVNDKPGPSSKSKKSRAKRPSGEKKKRERKSRAKVAPPPPEQTSTPPQLESQAIEDPEEQLDTQQPPEPASTEVAKPKRIRIRDSKGKKKLPKFALKFAKTKKRKRLGSSDNDQSDLDKTPPPSPDEVESGVQKRRSARNTKKLKYNDDIALGFSESDDESQTMSRAKKTSAANVTQDGETTGADDSVVPDEPTVFAAPVEDTMVVEKIMASRMGQRELEPEPGEVLPPDGTHIEVEEFYVKYKNLSYLHCDWRTLEELEKGDRRVAQKVKRYKQKKDSSNLFSFMDEELFDLQYCEVDRILAVNEVEELIPVSDDEDKVENSTDVKANDNDSSELKAIQENPKVDNETLPPESSTLDKPPSDSSQPDKPPLESSTDGLTTTEPGDPLTKELKPDDEMETEEKKEKLTETEETPMEEIENADIEPMKPVVSSDSDSTAIQKSKKMKKKVTRHYLVKWRSLSYEESTWELEDDLDPYKIKQFERFKDPPPKSKWRAVKRPKPEDWVRKEASPVYKNNNTLREYQLEGINWLSFCWHQGRNCILADEMGLGKTIQSIAFINEIYQYGINGPFLIIVPLSTVGNWAREFETWTDLNVITYHGSSTSREMLKEYEMFYRNEQGNRITSYFKFQVMITTFEIILSDCLDLREIPWKCCIIDEAHRLKNRNCKLLEGLRLLNMEHRVLLTGTPLQNNVEELFSLLNFLEPTQFSSTEQFLQEFGDLKTEAQVDKLKLILKPMMLRRLKEDVEKTLAPKEETIVEVELTNIQKKYYRAILEKNFSFLTKGSSSNNMPNLMNTMMELRKCCIHPYLINGAEEQIMYEARQARLAGGEPMSSYQAMVNSSGKLVLIDKLLPRLRADGHRVLIFSQMVRCLDILEDYVTHKHYPFERIDGRVRGSDRQQAIDRFSKPGSDRFVFLLCTRAGGLGINLTAADTVIIFDSDWNPQNDLQAQARCHRIGQSKAVKIYRLICRNTYEREMFDKASLKLGLDKAVLQSMNTQKGGPGGIDGQLTKKEIEELLRKGAYGALMDDDNAGDKFCEEDIDQILQRRTQVITIDNSEAKGSTFSKATFSSSNNREDIELDDPNFWEKWAKKANIDSDDLMGKDELIQLEPRRRTQTKRYGADGTLLDISDLDSSEEDEETISMRTRGSRGRQPKLTPSSTSKRNKRSRLLEYDDDEFLASLEGGFWSKSDCLKVEKGLLTYGWGRWEEIIASHRYKRDLTVEDCENICRVILLYCVNSYKGDEKIKTFAWELITPPEEASKSQSELDASFSTRGRKPKSMPVLAKKSTAEEIADANWPKEAKYDPLIALPDDQYRRHLQRNCNRLLIRVKFLHYLRNDILREYNDKILTDCSLEEIDLPPVIVDGDLPTSWWDHDADKSLLVGIFKHGHDKFSLMRQDPNLSFFQKCGPPNKNDLLSELSYADKNMEDIDDENRDTSLFGANVEESTKFIKGLNASSINLKDVEAGKFLDNLLSSVVSNFSEERDLEKFHNDAVDENKNSILKCSDDSTDNACENGINESSQTTKMEITDDESLTNDASIDATSHEAPVIKSSTIEETMDSSGYLPFPSASDLNQRFRRLITAYQRNSKKLEIQLAQRARDELKKERTSKFEAAKNEREERKRTLAQKWSRREEADFFRAISSFGVEYDPMHKKHDWNRFRSIGKLEKKLDETLEEYYRAFVIMCKKVLSKPLTLDEEKCPINVDAITEDRASRCLARIEFLNKIREQIITHPELDERLKLCQPQSDLPDWWENGKHDKDLLYAAAKHGLTRLDYNLAHDASFRFDEMIKQKAELIFSQPPISILIPLEQLQELLERNGIEYLKDLELQDDSEDVKSVLDSILDKLELDDCPSENGYKSFAELVDGPHSRASDDSPEKSILSTPKVAPKTTRSSIAASVALRPLPNIISRRGANTVVRSGEAGSNSQSVRLTSLGQPSKDRRVVEITPIMPDKIPDDPAKSFEAGEISLTIQSESALLKMDDRPPIVLMGAANPITAKIRWPKDRAIQTRLENLVTLVEKNEWPTPPRPSVPTITLPNPMASSIASNSLGVTTSSPTKNDKDMSLGSPKSDISNISSRTSRQDIRERVGDVQSAGGATGSSGRGRRGRGRKPRQSDSDVSVPQDMELPKDDRQAAAKLRNLLSQGPSSNRDSIGNNPSTLGDKLTAKFGGNKQGAGLSSLLASFKQKRVESSGSSRNRDENTNILDLNIAGSANLLPQILANMKPEFRELLANQDAAQMLINSLNGMTSAGNVGANLRSSGSTSQISIDNLLNAARSSSKGPPPAHQHSDNAPSAHGGNSSSRELRRNSQNTRDTSPPSISSRSTRGKSSLDALSHQKAIELALGGKVSCGGGGKRRGKTSASTSDSPPQPGADILDLSSLTPSGKSSSTATSGSKSRRHRDQSQDESTTSAIPSTRTTTSVPTKANLKAGTKQASSQETENPPEKGTRTTRASKRIGSRIDALALNLQAKRMNRDDSPSADLSPSLPRDKSQEPPMAAHGSNKQPGESKSHSSKAPPAAHSSFQKSSTPVNQSQRDKSNQPPASNIPTQAGARQDPLAQFMSNPNNLLAGFNPATLGGPGDLMNQLLRKTGTNDIVKNLLNEFMKNPSLSLDPNVLATLTSSFPMTNSSLPGFSLPTSTPTNLPPTSSKATPSSLLNDFKPPGNSLMKRSKQESTSTSSSNRYSANTSGTNPSNDRRTSSSTPDRHERRTSSSSDRRSSSSSSYQDRPDKHSKHDKRSSGNSQQDLPTDSSSSRRSSSSLLAQQVNNNQQTSQAQTTPTSTPAQPNLQGAASTLNLANQFGGLNSLTGLLGFPGMNELMKQMSGFSGLPGALPRVSPAPVPSAVPNSTPTTNANISGNSDKNSRRSRQSSGNSSTQAQVSTASGQQQAANAALANSIMNLASQPNANANPYGNYANPLANPFLPFGLANLGMNNPLGMGLFPNLYMPSGFPSAEPQQTQQPSNQSGGTPSDTGSKDKKMRYPRK